MPGRPYNLSWYQEKFLGSVGAGNEKRKKRDAKRL
jgi:hypothetical protein